MKTEETSGPFVITKDRKLTMPIALIVTLVVFSAVAYSRITTAEEKLQQHSSEISDIKVDARTTREILIRIDENVKDLRRDARRNP